MDQVQIQDQDSLDILSELFDQFDVDVGLQQSGTHLLQHGVQHLTDRPTNRKFFSRPLFVSRIFSDILYKTSD